LSHSLFWDVNQACVGSLLPTAQLNNHQPRKSEGSFFSQILFLIIVPAFGFVHPVLLTVVKQA
jgi:hypothetical protein